MINHVTGSTSIFIIGYNISMILRGLIIDIFRSSRVCLIMVSRDRNPANFFALQKVRESILTKIKKKKIFEELLKPNQSYTVNDVNIPDLTHFLYFW